MSATSTSSFDYGDRLTPEDYASLLARWIPAAMADLAGIRRVTAPTGQEMFARKRGDLAGLIIPNVAPWDGGHIREYRLRLDHPPLEQRADGSLRETGKYIQPPGRPNLLYFPGRRHARDARGREAAAAVRGRRIQSHRQLATRQA